MVGMFQFGVLKVREVHSHLDSQLQRKFQRAVNDKNFGSRG